MNSLTVTYSAFFGVCRDIFLRYATKTEEISSEDSFDIDQQFSEIREVFNPDQQSSIVKPVKKLQLDLQLEGIAGNSQFEVAARVQKHSKDLHTNEVALNVGGTVYAIDINDMAGHLQINPDKLKRAHKESRLKELLSEKEKKGKFKKLLPKLSEDWEFILQHYRATKEGQLIPQKTKHAHNLVLNPSTIFKALKVYHKSSKTGVLKFTPKNIKNYPQLENLELYAGRTRSGHIALISTNSMEEIGKGSLGVVYKVISISEGIFKSYKQAQIFAKAKEKVEQEMKTLIDLEAEGIVDNMQSAPDLWLKLGENKEGFVGTLYDMSLYDYLIETDLSKQERTDILNNLIRAMEKFHRKGYRHGDIKVENILMDGNTPKIADHEGTHIPMKRLKFEQVPLTPISNCIEHMKQYFEALDSKDPSLISSILEKMDTMQLGKLIVDIASNLEFDFPTANFRCPNDTLPCLDLENFFSSRQTDTNFRMLKTIGLSKEALMLISNLLEKEQPMTMKEALNFIERVNFRWFNPNTNQLK